ncbi:MAG: hypothetical protein AAF529_10470 [Pseudomonadota bacterium]
MTKRTAHQQRKLEFKARMMARVANRLFTFKQTGLDGLIKRQLLGPPKRKQKPAEQSD